MTNRELMEYCHKIMNCKNCEHHNECYKFQVVGRPAKPYGMYCFMDLLSDEFLDSEVGQG